MNLNLFERRDQVHNEFIDNFIEELKNALKNRTKEGQNRPEKNNELDEYNIYEKKKMFLDNKSRKGNDLAWVMDENSVCISEAGDGGTISINEIELPQNKKIGEVYEKIDGKYVKNLDITMEIKNI